MRKELYTCDGCHHLIEFDRDRFVVFVHPCAGQYTSYDICRACIKYQPIPITEEQWHGFNGNKEQYIGEKRYENTE